MGFLVSWHSGSPMLLIMTTLKGSYSLKWISIYLLRTFRHDQVSLMPSHATGRWKKQAAVQFAHQMRKKNLVNF